MEGNCQNNDIDYTCDLTKPLPKKRVLNLQRDNGRAVSITTSHYLNTRNLPMRQHVTLHVVLETCFK